MRITILLLVPALLPGQELPQGATPLDPPASARAVGAHLSASPEGVILSWLEPVPENGPRHFALRMATLEEDAWSQPRTVTSGTDLFVNWADFPSITRNGDRLLAHWLRYPSSGRGHAYDIALALSEDDGASWVPLGAPHGDGTATEHGFVSVLPEGEGFRVFWLDGRRMAQTGHPGPDSTMELRTVLVATGTPNEPEQILDPDVCSCCQTGAALVDGRPTVVYRDHTAEEIRDISITDRKKNAWSAPRSVHDDGWRMPACPVNGPVIAAVEKRVAVAWFTAAADDPRVLLSLSSDGGASFSRPLPLDNGEPLGRCDLTATADGVAVVWWGKESNRAVLRLVEVSWQGEVLRSLDLACSKANRSTGFPRVRRQGADLVVVWRSTDGPPRLRGARIR